MVTYGQFWAYSSWEDAFDVGLSAVTRGWVKPWALFTAQWFDSRTAELKFVKSEKPFKAAGKKTFTPPTSGGVDFD